MGLKKFILKDSAGGTELILPVTPESFTVSHGTAVEKVNVHGVGDVNLWGYGTLGEIKLDFSLPSGDRDYAFSGGYTGNPYGAVEQLRNWIDGHKILRFIVSETPVNVEVMPKSINYGEQDGTGDVNASLVLAEHRTLAETRVESTGGTGSRPAESGGAQPTGDQSYTVVKGDTYWAIAKKYYGDPQLCWKLASYNGVKNANIIHIGDVVKIPDKSKL